MSLDWELRKDIVAVILAWNNGPFGEKDLTEALCQNGDRDLEWFRRGLTDEEAAWSK